MNIGILGTGMVGKTLAAGFVKFGYQVMVGSRNPEKINDWKDEFGTNLKTGTFKETAEFANILVLATKGNISKDVLQNAGFENLSGKTILDTTNPIADLPPENGVIRFFTNLDESLMEHFQSLVPNANFVKAFSCIGAPFMVEPPFNPKPSMFICGNSNNAKNEAKEILEKFGWEVEDMGNVEAARAIEPLCILWCIPGFKENKWSHAFKLLKL